MSFKEKVIRGVGWIGLQGAVSKLTSFLVFLVLARLLDPDSFGLVAIASVALAFFELFTHFGFGAAIIQREEVEKGHLDTAFWSDISASVLMMVVMVFSAGLVADLYNEPRLEGVIQALSLLFLATSLSKVQVSILRRKLAFRTLAIRSFAAEVLGGGAGIILAFQGFGVWSLVARQLVTALSKVVILWALSEWRPGLAVSYKHFRDLFGFSVNMMFANMVAFFGRKSDSFLIGYFLGATELGYYTVAYRFIEMLTEFLSGTINRVTWPAFARLQNDLDRLQRGFYTAAQILTLGLMPAFLGIFSLAPDLIPLMFGDKWSPSILIMQILAFIGIVHSISRMYDAIIVSMGRAGVWLGLRTAIAICNVAAFLIAVRWGIVGVAVAYVAVGYLSMPAYLVVLKRMANISIGRYLGDLIAPATGGLVMVGVLFASRSPLSNLGPPGFQVAALLVIGVVAYVGWLLLVAPGTVRHVLSLFQTMLPGRHTRRGS